MPENTVFYINQGYHSFKDNKKVYYNDVYIIAQIMPFSQQPKNIEDYELKKMKLKSYDLCMIPLAANFLELNIA